MGVDPSDIVVIDKARFPRPKLCGGGVTYRGTQLLSSLVGQQPPGGGRTMGLEFASSLGRFDVRERGPQWVHDRSELDHFLLDRVRACSVEVREGETVVALEPAHDAISVTVRGATRTVDERFAWVVGADGASGISRRASGLRGGIVGRLIEGVFEQVDGRERPDVLYFDFDPICDGIPGYAWIFPYFVQGALAGWKIGVMDGRGVVSGEVLRAWTLRYAAKRGYRPLEAKLSGFPERYWDWDVRGHREGLVLIGEAFGIDALLGEGIAPAMYSADYAARRLKQSLDRGTRVIRGYERGFWASEEGKNLWFQARLADRLYGPHPARWLRVLFSMDHLASLAGSGREAYGRLVGHMPGLVARFVAQVARRGMPSAAPVEREASTTVGAPRSLLHLAPHDAERRPRARGLEGSDGA